MCVCVRVCGKGEGKGGGGSLNTCVCLGVVTVIEAISVGNTIVRGMAEEGTGPVPIMDSRLLSGELTKEDKGFSGIHSIMLPAADLSI